jgi:hypothetical protein
MNKTTFKNLPISVLVNIQEKLIIIAAKENDEKVIDIHLSITDATNLADHIKNGVNVLISK